MRRHRSTPNRKDAAVCFSSALIPAQLNPSPACGTRLEEKLDETPALIPAFGEPGVCPTIVLFSSTTNQFPIGGSFSTASFRLRVSDEFMVDFQSEDPVAVPGALHFSCHTAAIFCLCCRRESSGRKLKANRCPLKAVTPGWGMSAMMLHGFFAASLPARSL